MRVAVIVGLVVLASAGASALLYRFVNLRTDPAVESVVARALDDMKAGHGEALRARMTPKAAATITPDKLQTLQAYVPKDAPTKRRLVNFTYTRGGGRTVASVRYELSYPDDALLYAARLEKSGDAWRLEGFNLQRATPDELAANRFTLAKPPGMLLFLLLTILAALTTVTAFVSVLCAPRFKRKWMWAILSLLGLGAFSLNWTSGQAGVEPFMVNLVGVGVWRMGYLGFSPWMFKFTLPVGALLAFWRVAKAKDETPPRPPLDEVAAGA
jgi:hypothetical protein